MTAKNAATTKQIFCIKWGTSYGAKDVNILYAMVARHITGPFQVYCFTDQPDGIRSEVKCLPLPSLGCEIPPDVPGKWPKIALWGGELFGLQGMALFIDLDSVIMDNIDCYFEYGNEDDVITARNWLNLLSKSCQTSVFRFKIGSHPYMLENLRANPAEISRKYQFEQNYVTHNVRGGVKFWPEKWTRHFRVHCLGSLPFRYFRKPIIPRGVKIITFPGLPGPSDAVHGRWTEEAECRTPAQHLRHVCQLFRQGKRWRKELSNFMHKPDWLGENWRE
ncbi:MAG: glycosyl transferase [Akkermansiaceae bacterium]